jgi:hypothetical protein
MRGLRVIEQHHLATLHVRLSEKSVIVVTSSRPALCFQDLSCHGLTIMTMMTAAASQ